MVTIRKARIQDVRQIQGLINQFARQELMLARSLSDIYEHLRDFWVCLHNNRIVGCCALQIIWSDLAEVKSLAVKETARNTGVGKALVLAAEENAVRLALPKIFALTLKPQFFEKLGYQTIPKDKLPMKVWKDCARCPKQNNCDEVAVIKTLQ